MRNHFKTTDIVERGRKGLTSKAGEESCPRASALLSPAQTHRISTLCQQLDVVLSPSLHRQQLSAHEDFVPAAWWGRERVLTSRKAARLSPTRGLLTAVEGATRARSAGEFTVPQTVPCARPGLSPEAQGQDQAGAGARLVLIYCSKWRGDSVPHRAPVTPDD